MTNPTLPSLLPMHDEGLMQAQCSYHTPQCLPHITFTILNHGLSWYHTIYMRTAPPWQDSCSLYKMHSNYEIHWTCSGWTSLVTQLWWGATQGPAITAACNLHGC
mgnify:CR=1 FL=1